MFAINPKHPIPLVLQIVDGFRGLIESGALRPGVKVPSIRQFAQSHGVSVYTVVDAYDRLVALSFFVSRAQSGFFVHRREPSALAKGLAEEAYNFDAMWYLRRVFENRALRLKPGCGWLPGDWLFEDGVRRSLRALAAEDLELGGYGEPKGFAPLRNLIRDLLSEHELALTAEQVLLTQGSSQAMDLIARLLVRPGDVVLVDAPGYANVLASLRMSGARLVGVPRTPQGYDTAALEQLVLRHKPKAFFTQPRLQSPTGSVAHISHLHRIVQLAEAHDIVLVENDIYADLDTQPRPSLASIDQLNRVIYVSSFSKTISPNLRVGYLAARDDLIEDLARLKMVAGLTSSELTERLTYGTLIDGRWRKHLRNLRQRLANAHERVGEHLERLGFELFCTPKAGIGLWARHPDIDNAAELAYKAAEQDILLGPGHLFMPDLSPSPWLRFNVAFSDEPVLFDFLARHCK